MGTKHYLKMDLVKSKTKEDRNTETAKEMPGHFRPVTDLFSKHLLVAGVNEDVDHTTPRYYLS